LIFAVMGVHEHGFDRLVKAIDELARKGVIQDVLIQTGFSTYEPKFCEWRKAIDFEEFEKMMDKADVIITHGGAGCIAGALERVKPTIVVPRLKKYDEHNNDHQLELASALEKAGRVLVVHDVGDLAQTIEKAWSFKSAPPVGESRIVSIIRDYLIKTAKQKGLKI
jgi:UDP-N-acetylglucosamine transferase subunit ALG13